MSAKVTISEDIYSPFVSACVCVVVWKSDSYSEIVWKLRSVDLPGGGKMMSKRQICIYRQTGILDLTAIQSLSACHVSPEGHPAFSQSSRFPCIRRSPISLPVSNSKAIVNQKDARRTKQGVIFMNVSARALLKPSAHLEQWAWQLNRGFFQSREMIPSKTTGGMKPESVPQQRRHGGKSTRKSHWRYSAQLGETQPVTLNKRERISDVG